jgi:N-acetylmuramoyl-L-alanine amidase
MGKIGFTIVITILFAFSAFAGESLDLCKIAEQVNATLYWNPLLETGILENSNGVVSFSLQSKWFLFDWNELYLSEGLSINEKGEIQIPETSSSKIFDFFKKKEAENELAPVIRAVIVDPGHGGKDPGAHYSYTIKGKKKELFEKNITCDIALLLNDMLVSRYPDKKIILTRNKDEYKKLEERVDIANSMKTGKHEAVIYISIHVNAAFNRKATGYQVWYLPNDYRRSLIDEKNVKTNEKEILPILNTMLEEEYTIESISLARDILRGLGDSIGQNSANLGIKAESWFVVRNAKMPSVLIETGFLSNGEEAQLLNDPDYLKKLASGIYNGVLEFIAKFEHTKGFTE